MIPLDLLYLLCIVISVIPLTYISLVVHRGIELRIEGSLSCRNWRSGLIILPVKKEPIQLIENFLNKLSEVITKLRNEFKINVVKELM